MSTVAEQIDAALAERQRRHEAYVAVVRKLEAQAVHDPKGYRWRVWTMAMMGYGYIFAILALCIAGAGWIGWSLLQTGQANSNKEKMLLVCGFLIVMILRSLWVKVEPPTEPLITRDEAPELYREVDAIADRLNAPRPDEIRIGFDVNAAAVQMPRYGIFGGYRNVLVLGLPLLMGLSSDEARAVVAHEFGHFSGQHGRFAVWIYRLEQTWRQLAVDKTGKDRKGLLFEPFLRWFYPRFSATTFALRRANEYEADAAAASVAGAQNLASALIRLRYLPLHLKSTFWDRLTVEARETPKMPDDLVERMAVAAESPADPEVARTSVEAAFVASTGYDDTHPSLSDRLRALGRPLPKMGDDLGPWLPEAPSASGLESFLGPSKPGVLARLETHLGEVMSPQWAENHSYQSDLATTLTRLEALMAEKPLTEQESIDLARATAELHGEAAAERRWRELLANYPESAIGSFVLGQTLLGRGDEEGVALVQKAAATDPDLAMPAREVLAGFYQRRGDRDRVAQLQREALEETVRRRQAERVAHLLPFDEVDPHDLTASDRQQLGEDLAKVDLLEAAYVVNKTLPGTEEVRTYLIVFFKRKLIEAEDSSERLVASVAAKLTLARPLQIEIDQPRSMWARKLRDTPEALVFDRKSPPLKTP